MTAFKPPKANELDTQLKAKESQLDDLRKNYENLRRENAQLDTKMFSIRNSKCAKCTK